MATNNNTMATTHITMATHISMATHTNNVKGVRYALLVLSVAVGVT